MNPEALLAHDDFVRGLARRLVRDRNRADDLAQETWLHALTRKAPRVGSERRWLAGIVRNASRDAHRSETRRDRRDAAGTRNGLVPSTAEIVERETVRRQVVDAVLRLDEIYRSVVLLRFYELLAPRAIAKRLGIPVETVRTRIKRGLERLRVALGIDFDPPVSRGKALVALAHPLGRTLGKRILSAIVPGGIIVKTTSKIALVIVGLLILGLGTLPFILEQIGASRHNYGSSADSTAGARVVQAAPLTPSKGTGSETASEPTAGPALVGRVVDESGAPVAGARMFAHASQVDPRFSPEPDAQPPDLGAAPVSGADGRFEIPVAVERATHRLFVEALGFSPNVVDAVAGEPVTIVLEQARVVLGTVRDAGERPIAGARVRVAGLIGPVPVEREAITSADGSFRVDGIPTERIRRGEWRTWCLIASATGFAPHLTPFDDLLRSTVGREIRFDPYLVPGASVRGRVLDAETGAPIDGAALFLWSAECKEYPHVEISGPNPWCPRLLDRARSDASGTFRFDHVPAEGPLPIAASISCNQGMVAAMIGVIAPSYAPAQGNIVVSPDGAELEVDIRCWPAAVVRGRVVGEDGLPKSGVNVFAGDAGRWSAELPAFCGGTESCRSVTDQEGRYVLRGVAATRADSDATVSAWLTPFGDVKATVTLKAGETAIAPDLVFPATHDRVVRVKVTDERGAPVAGARLLIDGSAQSQVRPDTDARGENLILFRETVRDVRLIVQAAGFAPATSQPFTPVRDQAVTVTVALDRGHRLTGRARWRNGDPAKSVNIFALDPALSPEQVLPHLYGKNSSERLFAEYAYAQTQADGSFEIRVRRGAAQRLIGPPSDQPTVLDVPADAKDVTFVIQDDPPRADEGGVVEGTVVERASSRPVMSFSAEIVVKEKWFRVRRIGPGRFRASGLPEGVGKLRVTPEGLPPAQQDVVLDAGRTATVAIVVGEGVTLRGRIIVGGDVNLEGTIVALKPAAGGHDVVARARADGRYEIAGLAPGRYRVTVVVWEPHRDAQYDFAPTDTADLEVTRAPEQTHDIAIAKGTRLGVHVRSGQILKLLENRPNLSAEERAVLDETRIEVRDVSGRLVRSNRGFTESSWLLPNGAYEVLLSVPGGASQRQRVVLDGRDTVYASFDLD